MSEQPGLPLTTGEGNTAALQQEWLDEAVAATELARENVRLLAECGRLREQRDKLGNELAQERAKPGGSWDQAAFAQVQDEAGRLREQLDAARQALEVYADARHWAVTRDDFRVPSCVWIGPGADDTFPNPVGVARAALGVEGPAAGDGQP